MTILAEKENVAKNYAKALKLSKTNPGLYESPDKKIKLTYAAGHLYTSYDAKDYDEKYAAWTEKTLPIIPTAYFYKPIKEKYEFRKNCEKILRKAIETGDEIVIATDPDREGEVIARLILKALKADFSKITRVWACEGLDEKEVLKGISNRKPDCEYDQLAEQGIMQKQSDWVIGINLSRAYTILNNGELYTIGRVQTAVLKIIYERQQQIMLFIKKPYYQCQIQDEKGNEVYLFNPSKKSINFDSKEEIQKYINERKGTKGKVIKVVKEKKSELPPRLYDLAGLQQDAFTVYKIAVDQTLEIAQKLYNEEGVISYPRTDSVALSESDSVEIRKLYKKLSSQRPEFTFCDDSKITEENRRLFNSKETSGHHGIIPSNSYEKNVKNERLFNIYDLVLRRFLMAGMGNYEWDKTEVTIQSGSYILKGEGKKVTRKGWTEAELKEKEGGKEIVLEEGEEFEIRDIKILEKETQPPKFFNQATIIKFMRNPYGEEEEGIKLSSIGTEATQASIVKRLFEIGYITEVKKHIEITKKGIALVEQIMENPVLNANTDVKATTEWEKLNKENPKELLQKIENVTRKSIEAVRSGMETVIEKKNVCICPACGKNIMRGKSGYYCEGYKDEPKCENTISYKVMGNDIDDDFIKNLCEKKTADIMSGVTKGGESVSFQFKIDENGKFTCTFLDDDKDYGKCPKCQSKIFRTQKVYKCDNGKCDFFLWRESSGVKYTDEMVKDLVQGRSVKAVQKKKDGSSANVEIKLEENWTKAVLTYVK